MSAIHTEEVRHRIHPASRSQHREKQTAKKKSGDGIGSLGALYINALAIAHEAVARYREFATHVADRGIEQIFIFVGAFGSETAAGLAARLKHILFAGHPEGRKPRECYAIEPLFPAPQRGAASRFQALLLIVYPLALLPLVLAYLARSVFESELVFWGLVGFAAVVGAVVYWISMESAVGAAHNRREALLAELSGGEGPVAAQ